MTRPTSHAEGRGTRQRTLSTDRSSGPGDAIVEQISPELVLVDPELRRRRDAGLLEIPHVEAAPTRATVMAEPRLGAIAIDPPRATRGSWSGRISRRKRFRRQLVSAVLAASVFANGVLVAMVLTTVLDPSSSARVVVTMAATPTAAPSGRPKREGDSSPPKPSPLDRQGSTGGTTTTESRAVGQGSGEQATDTQGAPRRTAPTRERRVRESPSSAPVERAILALLVRSPGGKLPPALIDPTTGLAKNNLQAVCRPGNSPGEFHCVVRPSTHRPREGLPVRYRELPNGEPTFVWGRYRAG